MNFLTLIYTGTDLYFLCIFLFLSVINFTPFTTVSVIETYVNSLKSKHNH